VYVGLRSWGCGSLKYLPQPLCNWFNISTWHHQGEWFINTNKRKLLHKAGNQWFANHRQGRRTSQ
jgi:hypothetical protein